MRLHKVSYGSSEFEHLKVEWFGTGALARARKTELKKEGFVDIKHEENEVPTAKAALIEFLNAAAARIDEE